MRRGFHVSALAIGAMLVSCGGKAKAPVAPPLPASKDPAKSLAVTPSRLFPELVGGRGVVATEEGHRRLLIDRMRIVARPDGSIERAADLLPGGNVASVALPSRLGGGYVFHVNAGGGTEMWRASSWLAKLTPLTRRGEVVTEIVPGFDRLYLRLSSGNRLVAIHAETGEHLPLGPLPIAGSYGQLAFADGWRAIVDTDLRGPLATFDGGATWRALGIVEKPTGVGIFGGDPAVLVASGRYVVDARGGLSHRTDSPPRKVDDDAGGLASLAKKGGPLGKRPLRAAVEDGWPEGTSTAIVARGGALARVSLRDGSIVAIAEDAYPETRAACHAVRLGVDPQTPAAAAGQTPAAGALRRIGVATGIGFICGERDGATVVYEHVPPLAMRPVLRFEKPRFIAASGNGSLTIRGRCEGEGAPDGEADARWYCVRSPAGTTREIRVKGFDLGVERVVGLADGRVAVLVPPRGGSAGDLSIVGVDGRATKVALQIPDEPQDKARVLKRGLWLDGFEERSPGVLGGFVEAGGPVVGVEIKLDGTVKAGDLQAETSGVILGGRFGVVLLEGGRALETIDGGMTYKRFDLPERDEEARAIPTRAAGPVGAALPGWVRVGWGDPETKDDMKPAAPAGPAYVPFLISPTIALGCDVASVATPPLPDKPKVAAAPPPRSPPSRIGMGIRPVVRRESTTPWIAFRNTAPPALAAEEMGVDNGVVDGVGLRAYAWGKRGADWSRTGRWMMRFDDRFDPAGGVRSSAVGGALWSDESAAHEAISGGSYGAINWSGFLDAGGHGLLASACRGGGSSCALFAVGEGQPALPLRDAAGHTGGFLRPFPGSAVRVGDTWFFLAQSASYDAVALYRVDLGVARPIGTYFRPIQRYAYDTPRLVRRALGGALGILVSGQPDPDQRERAGTWYVLPVDAETGAIGEATALARRDFSTTPLTRCAPDQDGWMVDIGELSSQTAVAVDLDNARGTVDNVDVRVRLDPGRACVEAFSGRTPGFYAIAPKGSNAPSKALTAPPGKKGGGDANALIPFAVNERGSGRRWGLTCKFKAPKRPNLK